MSITMTLEDEIDISRGDMIVRENNTPTVGQELDVLVTWMNNKPLNPRTSNYKTYNKRMFRNTMKLDIKLISILYTN